MFSQSPSDLKKRSKVQNLKVRKFGIVRKKTWYLRLSMWSTSKKLYMWKDEFWTPPIFIHPGAAEQIY